MLFITVFRAGECPQQGTFVTICTVAELLYSVQPTMVWAQWRREAWWRPGQTFVMPDLGCDHAPWLSVVFVAYPYEYNLRSRDVKQPVSAAKNNTVLVLVSLHVRMCSIVS